MLFKKICRQNNIRHEGELGKLQGQKKIQNDSYNVMITDIGMPGNQELELVSAIKQEGVFLPTILVTSHPSIKTAINSIKLPILAYLIKPVKNEELLEWVLEGVKRSQSQQAMLMTFNRLQEWQSELLDVMDSLDKNKETSGDFSMEVYLNITLRNIVGAVTDLTSLVNSHKESNILSEIPCSLLSCPRLDQQHAALKEAVNVLEKTKNSFKSKELGMLRRKLDVFLNQG